MIKKITEVSESIIGKSYLVPHVEMKEKSRYGIVLVPVLLPYHEDKNLGLAEYHYHYDLRFISERLFQNNYESENNKNRFQVLVLNEAIIKSQEIIWRKKKCLRDHLPFPKNNTVTPVLESLYEGAIAVNKVCPHRGISLVGCHTKDGIMNCPGHGLQWCEKTGKLHKQPDEKRLNFNEHLAAIAHE